MSERIGKTIFTTVAVLTLLFTLTPLAMLFVGSLNEAPAFSFPFPLENLTLNWFISFLESEEFRSSLQVSVVVALASMCIGVVAGVPAAFAIKRYVFKGRMIVNTMVTASMTLPRVIMAIALLQFFSAIGILGSYLGLILAHSLFVIPYTVRMVLSSLSFVGEDVESAALSLGASPVRTFFEVTLPLISPGILVSAFFGFVASFTDSVVAVFIAGARNITFPVRVYSEQRGQGLDPEAVAGSAIIILVIFLILILFEKLFKWSRLM